jgi:hypothetical protein
MDKITGISVESTIQKNKVEIQNNFKESEVETKFNEIYEAIKVRVDKLESKSAESVLPIIHEVLKAKGYKYVMNKPVAHGIKTMEMDCNIIAGLYVDLGKKLGLDISAGYFPGHVFVIGKDKDGKDYWWEATSGFHSDETKYADKLTPELKKQGYPIKISADKYEWTHAVEMGGMLIQKGRLAEATAFYEKALKAEPRNIESLGELAQLYWVMGAEKADIKLLEKASDTVQKALAIKEDDVLIKIQKNIEDQIKLLQPLETLKKTEAAQSLTGPFKVEAVVGANTSEIGGRDVMSLNLKMQDAKGTPFTMAVQSLSFDAGTKKSELVIELKGASGQVLTQYQGTAATDLLKTLNLYGDEAWMQKALEGMKDPVHGENPHGVRFMAKLIFWAQHWGLQDLSAHVDQTGTYHVKLLANGAVDGSFVPDKEYLNQHGLAEDAANVWQSQFVFRNNNLYTLMGELSDARLKMLKPKLSASSSDEQILQALSEKLGTAKSTPPIFQIISIAGKKELLFSVLRIDTQHEQIYGKLIDKTEEEPGLFFDEKLDLKLALNDKGGTRVSYSRTNITGDAARHIIKELKQTQEKIKTAGKPKKEERSYKVVIKGFDGDTPIILKPNKNSSSGGYTVQNDQSSKKSHKHERPPYEDQKSKIILKQKESPKKVAETKSQVPDKTANNSTPPPAQTPSPTTPAKTTSTKDESIADKVANTFNKVMDWAFSDKSKSVAAVQGRDHIAPLKKIRFKHIPGGKFTMGHPKHEDNLPKQVTVSGFYMMETEFSQKNLKDLRDLAIKKGIITAADERFKDKSYFKGVDRLVENITWNNSVSVCWLMSMISGEIAKSLRSFRFFWLNSVSIM